MVNVSKFTQDSIFTCFAYCGKIDRMLYAFSDDCALIENTLLINAGFSSDLEPGSRREMIAKGTLEWLREFHKDPDSFSISNTSLKSMHRKLFKYSPRDDGTRGHYRTDLNDEMKALFEETKSELLSDERHTLLSISLCRVTFMHTMPFITGNTLCANLIAYALLVKHGYAVVHQVPLLASLNNADSGGSQDQISLLPKTFYELLSLLSAETPTDVKRRTPAPYLNFRRKSLLAHIQEYAPIKISDIMKSFPKESRNTIKKDLLYLREKKMIVAHGEGRGMYYIPVS